MNDRFLGFAAVALPHCRQTAFRPLQRFRSTCE
jgi:hypothetical protein